MIFLIHCPLFTQSFSLFRRYFAQSLDSYDSLQTLDVLDNTLEFYFQDVDVLEISES
jgi:hypothetical protein